MFSIVSAILVRIFSNSYINVFQKVLAIKGTKSSNINFLTYLGLFLCCIFLLPFIHINLTQEIFINALIMGVLGALGNLYIIKAFSIGELSSVAPINAYKPVVAGIIGFLYLNETPSLQAGLGFLLIVVGTYFLYEKTFLKSYKPVFYRILALIFSGSEAVFIKKIILLSDVTTSFILWVAFGLFFAGILAFNPLNDLKIVSLKNQIYLIIAVGIMQFATNYVFSHMNTAYALALFQLSTIISIFLGANIFKEKGIIRKITASVIMICGAVIIILG